MLWRNYSTGDDRLLLNKNLRIISILKDLFVTWFIALFSFIYAKTKRKKFLIHLLILYFLITGSGSKGDLGQAILVTTFFYFQFNTVSKKTKIKIYILMLFALFLPTFLMNGSGFINKIIHRIYMSGDIYLFAYVIGDYKKLINYYDPLMYILHPFFSMIGIRGYDFPLGAQILSTANLPVTGTGPNPHMTILNLVFFDDCVFCILLSSFIYGLIALLSVYLAFKILKTRLDSYFKVMVFIVLYTNQINLFIDIGMFEFNIIILLVGFFIYLQLEMLKKKYWRKSVTKIV